MIPAHERTDINDCRYCCRPRPAHAKRRKWVGDCCNACYKRWRYHGFPPEGPPPLRTARVQDYAELRQWGMSDRDAAARLGVSLRTVDRYKRELRETAAPS